MPVAYPDIVQYRLKETGETMNHPPLDGRAYFTVVHDLPSYEKLRSSGALSRPEHTLSAASKPVDRKPTA